MTDDQWLDDHIELYAIHSLPADEHARFEQELSSLTRAERNDYDRRIAQTRETMTGYASRFAQAAPDDLRDRVIADFDNRGGSAAAFAANSNRSRRRVLSLSAAAVIAIAVSLGLGVLLGRMTAPSEDTTPADSVASVLSAPDARVASGQLSGSPGSVTIVSSQTHNQAVAFLRGIIDPPPPDQVLQLWLTGKSATPISAGFFDSNSSPPVLIDGIDGADAFAITLEPRGGSPAPTTPPLTQIPL